MLRLMLLDTGADGKWINPQNAFVKQIGFYYLLFAICYSLFAIHYLPSRCFDDGLSTHADDCGTGGFTFVFTLAYGVRKFT